MASRSWNRVELIGNLTRDPELRYTPNGAAVCTFGMATNRTYVSEGEKKEEVDFHRLVAWNKLAEICNQFLKKGTKVFISGRLQTRSWTGQDGAQRQTTEIVVEDMIILTPKGSNGGMGAVPEDADVEPVKKEEPEESKVAEVKSEEESEVAEEKTEKPKEAEETKASEPEPEKDSVTEETSEKAPQEEVKDDLPF